MSPSLFQVRWAVAALVVFTALVCSFSTAAATQREEIPIHISGRTPVVEVQISGQGPFRFLIDTGSLHTMIDSKLAEELGLSLSEGGQGGDAQNAANEDSSIYYVVDSIRLGKTEFSDVVAKAWDSHPLSPGGSAPDGVLGTSVFEGSLVTIDNPKRLLTVEAGELPPANGAEILDFEIRDEAPVIQASIGDLELELELHSGGFGPLQLRPEQQEKLSLRSNPTRIGNVSIDGVTGDILGSRANGALTLGQHEIDRPSVYFCKAYPSDQLGGGALANFAITLDPANKRVRLRAEHSFVELLSLRAETVPSLSEGDSSLKDAFNRDSDKTRLVLILSPT